MDDQLLELPLKELYADGDFNCRGSIEAIDVVELAKDIKEKGLLSPLIVQPYTQITGKKYRILAGHRRHRALQMNAATVASCIVKHEISDIDAFSINLSENLQRKQLNIKEEAHSIKRLRMLGCTQTEISEKVGMSKGWVQIRYMVLDLPEEIQNEAAAGLLKTEDIRKVWSLPTMEQKYQLVREIKDAKILGKKREVDMAKIKKSNLKKSRRRDEILELQEEVQKIFGVTTFSARVLAWCAGEISDLELREFMKEQADRVGVSYQIPDDYQLQVTKNVD